MSYPSRGTVNRFTVYLQPFAHTQQTFPSLFRDRSIRFGTNIEQKEPIHADSIHEIIHQRIYRS